MACPYINGLGRIVSVKFLGSLWGPFDAPPTHRLFYIKLYVEDSVLNSCTVRHNPVLPAARPS